MKYSNELFLHEKPECIKSKQVFILKLLVSTNCCTDYRTETVLWDSEKFATFQLPTYYSFVSIQYIVYTCKVSSPNKTSRNL